MLPLFLIALLRTTPVQTYLSGKAAAYLSDELGTTVDVGGVDVSWFLNIIMTEVRVLDKHHATLLAVERLSTRFGHLNPRTRELALKSVSLSGANINLIRYKNDSSLNLQFILDYFASADTTPSTGKPWKLQCGDINLSHSHFAYRDERHMRPGKGMDYSDLDIANLNMTVRGIQVNGDTIRAHIKELTAKEKSGFNLKHFSAFALVTPRGFVTDSLEVVTDKSNLKMDLHMIYNNWKAFNSFIDSVRVEASIQPSELDMRDIVCYAPEIDGMNELFRLSGRVAGTVASFSGKEMSVSFGSGTRFYGDVKMSGLPRFEETFMNIKMKEFRTDKNDIEQFSLPYSGGRSMVEVPKEVAQLGSVIVKGRFTGFYNDFVSNATFYTEAGNVATNILLSNNLKEKIIEYNGHIQASGFNIGKVFDISQVGVIDLDAAIDGKGFSGDNADLTIQGDLTNFQLLGNYMDHIHLDGSLRNKRFDGRLDMKDDLAKLDFNGSIDFSDSLPAFDFKANLTDAFLTRLNLWERDPSSSLTTHMDFNFKGNTLDNLLGTLSFKNTVYKEKEARVAMKDLLLQTQRLQGDNKRMTLKSDFADAVFSGQYTFSDLAEYLTFVFTDYLPGLALVTPTVPRAVKGSFDYTVQIKNSNPLTQIFLPGVEIDPNTVVSGGFDPTAGIVNLNGRSPRIRLKAFELNDFSLRGATVNQQFGMEMRCASLDYRPDDKTDKPVARLERFLLDLTARNDSVRYRLLWNDRDSIVHNKADIAGAVSFAEYPALSLGLDTAFLLINDTVWSIRPGHLATIDTATIQAYDIRIRSENQAVGINGCISGDPLDQMGVDFVNFNLSQFDKLTASVGVDFDGRVNGHLSIADIYNVPLVMASLVVGQFGFNHEPLGDAEITSNWDNSRKAVNLDTRIAYHGTAGTHYPLLAHGSILTEAKHDNFDLAIRLDNIKLRVMQPFFTGLFSRMKGWGSGDLTLKGDFSDPVLAGSVKLMRSEMLVDYLRTTYSFNGDINFNKGLISFKDIKLADSVGNTGTTTGTIRHHAFRDWSMDVDVNSDNMTVLNTSFSPDEMYYGKARASGKMHLYGPMNDLKLDINAASAKGTEIFIPINYTVGISDNDYIFYVKADTTSKDAQREPETPSNLSLKMGLDVTRDASLEIILPYRMGNIKVRGDGLIDMGIDTRGDYTMHGQYIMDKGSFLFNLQDIFSRTFEIQKGSTIVFNGSPYDADINLQAVYKIKTNLSGLSSIPAEIASRRIPIDCIISLTNSLYNPDIHFSIAMPEADAETQRWVFGAIDTSNAVAMNQQMISLLVLNSFTSAGESSGITASGIGFSSFGIISSQLNNWLSQISKDFDIGVNYRPGDQMTAQELELALSTQLFNDRVVIDGAFGMSTSANATQNQNANQWIGDVNVEVKITEDGRFRVKAFNRTNTSLDLYSGQAPYTQGVGILYRKDFDRFLDLFRRQRQ